MCNPFKKLYKIYDSKIDKEYCDVGLPKRLFAYIIDWILGGIFTSMPGVFICLNLTKQNIMFENLYIFEALGYERYVGFLVGFLCFIFAIFYYVFVMWRIFPGQTIGKKIMGIKVVNKDNLDVNFKTIFIRQVVCIFLIEGVAYTISSYIRQCITLATRYYVDNILQNICIIFFILSAMLVCGTASQRALHDYISNTKVIKIKK